MYQFKQAGGAVTVKPLAEGFSRIEGRPVALGMWVYGDGSGLIPSVVLLDRVGPPDRLPGKAHDVDGVELRTL